MLENGLSIDLTEIEQFIRGQGLGESVSFQNLVERLMAGDLTGLCSQLLLGLRSALFQAVQSDVFLSDCKSFFHDAASFIQTFIGWTIDAGQSVAQISTKIPNEIIAGIIYWLLMILVVGICVAGTGILAILIEIKVIELYKKNCWDVITLLMILTSAAVIIYFGEVIKKALSINLLFFWLILQGIYLTIRRYISQDTD